MVPVVCKLWIKCLGVVKFKKCLNGAIKSDKFAIRSKHNLNSGFKLTVTDYFNWEAYCKLRFLSSQSHTSRRLPGEMKIGQICLKYQISYLTLEQD